MIPAGNIYLVSGQTDMRKSIAVGIPLWREHDTQRRDAFGNQFCRQFHRGIITGGIIIESDQHLLNVVLFERPPVIRGDAVHPVSGRDIALPRHPERHRINQRFAQDQRFGGTQRRFIPDPFVCPRQVQVTDNRLTLVVADFAPVQPVHLPLSTDNGHNQRTPQMLPPVLPQHPDGLQAAADLLARFDFFRWQTVAQRAVGKAQLKVGNQFRMIEPPFGQIGLCLRRIQKRMVIKRNHP